MPNIKQAILIGGSNEKVYEALTTQKGLAGWWTPLAEGETQLDSTLRFPFGNGYAKEMKVTALRAGELVKWDCISGADEWVGTSITFELLVGDRNSLLGSYPEITGQVEQQEGDICTLLVFHHEDWRADTLMFAECSFTWAMFLRSLKLLCETGHGNPWPNQHRSSNQAF